VEDDGCSDAVASGEDACAAIIAGGDASPVLPLSALADHCYGDCSFHPTSAKLSEKYPSSDWFNISQFLALSWAFKKLKGNTFFIFSAQGVTSFKVDNIIACDRSSTESLIMPYLYAC